MVRTTKHVSISKESSKHLTNSNLPTLMPRWKHTQI